MNQKRPLAYRIRPESFDEIVGHEALVGNDGVIRRMVEEGLIQSMVLYGPPGCGKTTIASVLSKEFGLNSFTFNASTDNKQALKDIVNQATHYGAMLIVDEIHRMKKDIQDFLLPHVEDGTITMVGLTTNNPYHSVNPAIRSRVQIFRLDKLSTPELTEYLKSVKKRYKDEIKANFEETTLTYIAESSDQEIRTAINRLELLNGIYPGQTITLDMAKKALMRPSLSLDKDEDNYFNILSALQKSIRGSDVNASLHYLARLVVMEDLDSILRRLTVIAYEDIGLANPQVITHMDACCRACERVGFPEARIPLAVLVTELALSPKSNAAYVALDKAIEDVRKGKTPKIPSHIINIDNFDDKGEGYKYPHDYDDHFVAQAYLPKELNNTIYYKPATTGKYERALAARYETLMKRFKE